MIAQRDPGALPPTDRDITSEDIVNQLLDLARAFTCDQITREQRTDAAEGIVAAHYARSGQVYCPCGVRLR
jgi:hypothetical protein